MALRQHHALQHLIVGRVRARGADDPGEPAEIVIAGERRQAQRGRDATFIQAIVLVEPRQHRVPSLPATSLLTALANPKSSTEGSLSTRVCRASCATSTPSAATSPKMWKFGMPRARARLSMAGDEGLPELGIHMPRGIDAESVDAVTLDPVAVDIDEPLHHARILGHEIVETDEVAEQRALAPEVRVAAVVIVDRGVQPGGHLHVGLGGRHERRVGVVGVREVREVGRAANAVAGKPGVDRRPCEPALA